MERTPQAWYYAFTPHPRVPNLFGDLTTAGIGWKNYVENLPSSSGSWNGSGVWEVGNDAARHVPAVFYQSVMGSASERAKVVNYSQLSTDLSGGTVPKFSYVGLNLIDDGHSGTLGQADTAVGNTVAAIQASTAWTTQRSLILIVWDEDSNTGGSNQVALIAVAKDAKPGFTSAVSYGHLNTLATIEAAVGDPTDRSGGASLMTDLFGTTPTSTPTPTPTVTPTVTPSPTVTSSPGARLFGATSLWNTAKAPATFAAVADSTLHSPSYGINDGAYDHPT